MTRRRSFPAMGCIAEIELVGGDDAMLSHAEYRLGELERRWSRFRADSDVSRLNAAGGRPTEISTDTVDLLTAMVRGWQCTAGAFDPTLLAPLVGLGYATSVTDGAAVPVPAGVGPVGDVGAIAVDTAARIAMVPVGTAIDPGGIGKGLAADVVVAELLSAGATGAMVSVGGDLAVGGDGPDGSWRIVVDDPLGVPETIVLASGGVATSGTAVHTWLRPGGERCHHLLDPRTARPTPTAGSGVVQVTVVAGSAMWAEVHTKVAMIGGAHEGAARLERAGLACRGRCGDGARFANAAWALFSEEPSCTPN